MSAAEDRPWRPGTPEAMESAIRWDHACRGQEPPDADEIEEAIRAFREEEELYGGWVYRLAQEGGDDPEHGGGHHPEHGGVHDREHGGVAADEEVGAEQIVGALAALPGPGPEEPGWAVLDCVVDLLRRFVAFPSPAARDAVTLWAVHAHAIDCFESTPRLALLSPEKGSGKTRTLEVLELVVPKPRHAVNMTAAALFRAVAAGAPTLLFDEADTYFGPKVADEVVPDLVEVRWRSPA